MKTEIRNALNRIAEAHGDGAAVGALEELLLAKLSRQAGTAPVTEADVAAFVAGCLEGLR